MNNKIKWTDAFIHPLTGDLAGKTVVVKTRKRGIKSLIVIMPNVVGEHYFSTAAWINESGYLYIVLPD